MSRNSNAGFTLIELIITVAIAGIVLSIATPSLREFVLNNRLTSQANELVTAFSMARSEAVKRDTRVTVCKSTDGLNCTDGGGWEQGWVVFVDGNNSATVDVDEEILRSFDKLEGYNTLRGNANVADFVSYINSGFSKDINGSIQMGTLVLCDERGFSDRAMSVVISSTGRVRAINAKDSTVNSCLL